MGQTGRRSTATRLHVMAATVEEDRDEVMGIEEPGKRNVITRESI